MFKGRFLAPVKIICWLRSHLLFTPFCLENVLGGCLNLYSIVFLLYLLVPFSSTLLPYVQKKVLGACQNRLLVLLSSPFNSFMLEEHSWRLSQSLLHYIIFYLVSFSLLYCQLNVLCDCLNLLEQAPQALSTTAPPGAFNYILHQCQQCLSSL
jgi:hypothetical protein